ncbi:MAG: hypothetical protein L3J63_09025, partial [Geopsychrobacter sp.]|nr:hypothetical protein [Geopsychrobacter sp.]
MQDKRDRKEDNGPPMGRIGSRPYWMLNLSLPIRAIHQVGAAVFLATYLLGILPEPPQLYVTIALVSGGLLMFSEW